VLKLGIPSWFGVFSNLGYELTDACTSIVAQTPTGKIYHARNLDFGEGVGFTATLRENTITVDYQTGNKTLYTGTTYAGYIGILSGMKPGAFSITVNTRFSPNGIFDIFYEVIAAITERNASLVSFMNRDIFQYQPDFKSALYNLANDLLVTHVYLIIAGTKAGEGVVLSRNPVNASDIWTLDYPNRWYLVQTNYDHWVQPPWYDDRLHPANNGMDNMSVRNMTLDGMLQVLSTKPVLNLQTTYSILSCPADGIYKSYGRYCKYPCPE